MISAALLFLLAGSLAFGLIASSNDEVEDQQPEDQPEPSPEEEPLEPIIGTDGDDVLTADTDGYVRIEAGAGDDTVTITGEGENRVLLGDGDDTAFGGDGFDRIEGGAGDDYIEAGEGGGGLFGDDGDDTLIGGSGGEFLSGGAGNDLLDGGGSGDFLDGGDGDDILLGGAGDDVIGGDGGIDRLEGGAGDDILSGGFEGGDTLIGGAGSDTYLLSYTAQETSLIEGFVPGEDRIRVTSTSTEDPVYYQVQESEAGTEIVIDGNVVATLVGGVDGFGADDISFDYSIVDEAGFGETGDVTGIEGYPPTTGTDGDDNFVVTGEGNTILGLGGDDYIDASAATGSAQYPTLLIGGEGEDVIYAVNPFTIVVAGEGDTIDLADAVSPQDDDAGEGLFVNVVEETGDGTINFQDWDGHRLVLDMDEDDPRYGGTITVESSLEFVNFDEAVRDANATVRVFVNGELFAVVTNNVFQVATEVDGELVFDEPAVPDASSFVILDASGNGYDYGYLIAA